MKPPPQKTPKKSEMLEVRLSHEDKQALQQKAASEGQSVSKVVRNLISNYLAAPEPRTPFPPLAEFIMTTKSSILKRPKAALASLACVIIPLTLLAPMSFANDLDISLEGEITRPEGDGKRVRTFAMQIIGDLDETFEFDLPSHDGSVSVKIKITETHGQAVIQMEIIDTVDGESAMVAMPELTADYGQSARVEVGTETEATYAMSILPKKL